MRLTIFDASGLLHAGTSSVVSIDTYTEAGNRANANINGMPIGGIRMLCSRLFAELSRGAAVALALDSKTDKSRTFEGYKSQRTANPGVVIQNRIVKEWFPRIGLPTFLLDNTEADDIINFLAKANYSDFETVHIVTGDYDVGASIVADNIHIVGASSEHPSYGKDNYKDVIRGGKGVEYNTILPYTIFYGKPSNNMPVFKSAEGYTANQFYNDFLHFCIEARIPEVNRSDKDVFYKWLDACDLLQTIADKKALITRAGVVIPEQLSDYSEYKVKKVTYSDLNMRALESFCRMFQLYSISTMLKLPANARGMTAEEKGAMRLYFDAYNSRDFNIDKDIPIETTLFSGNDLDTDDIGDNVGDFM